MDGTAYHKKQCKILSLQSVSQIRHEATKEELQKEMVTICYTDC